MNEAEQQEVLLRVSEELGGGGETTFGREESVGSVLLREHIQVWLT